MMNMKVYKKCYDNGFRDEYMVLPIRCPINREYCFGGKIWIGELKPECTMESICQYYVDNSFDEYHDKLECKCNEVKHE